MIDDPARSAGGTLGDYAYAGSRERPVSEVVKDIFGNVQEMVRSEIRLARVEMREEAARAANSAKLLGMGAGLAVFGVAFTLLAVTLLLSLFMPGWIASLIVGAALLIPGLVLLAKGREQLSMPTPHKTIENVKENVEWMKNQTRS